MTENKDILKKRYQWRLVEGGAFLDIDASNITPEQGQLAIDLVTNIYEHFDKTKDPKGKIRLVWNCTNSQYPSWILAPVRKIVKKNGHSDVMAAYGSKSPFMPAVSRLISPFLKTRARVFNKRQEAIDYVMRF